MFPLMLARRGHRVTTLTLRGAIGYLPHHPHSSFLHRTSRANAATSALPRSLGIPGAAVPLVDPVSAQRRPHNAGGGDRRPCTPTRPTQNASDRDSPSTTKRARKTSPTATAQREQKADEVHPNKGARGQSPSLRQTPTSPSGPKHGSSRQINERIVNCGSTADLKRYLGGVPVGRLSDVNLATAVTRLAKLRRAAPRLRSRSTDGGQISDGLIADVLNRLVPRATERVGRMEAQALANMVHSLGVLVELNPRVVAQLLLRLDAGDTPPAVAEMGPQELATTMWGYARLRRGVATGSRGQPSAELVQAVTRRAEVLMSTSDSPDQSSNTKAEFDQQNLANLLWAYGALRSRPSEDLLRAAETVIRRPGFAQTLTEQSLSSMLWALGSLGAPLNPLALETLIQRGLELSGSLSGQSVANIVWALAKLGCSLQSLDPALLYALAARAVQVRRELKTQEVANIQWGFARLGARLSNRQLEQLEARYVELTQSSAAGSIASAVSTIADTLVFGDRGGSGGRKEGAADTGARRQTREELGGALGARPEEVVALMWSYAMLAEPVQQRRPELYRHLNTKILGLCPVMSPAELSRVLWALVVMDTLHADDLGYVLLLAVLERHQNHDPATMSQLHQVFMAIDQMPLTTIASERLQQLVFRHRDHADACAALFRDNAAEMGRAASEDPGGDDGLAGQVFAVLQTVEPSARREVVLGRECGHYSVDAYIERLGVAIEVDGPYQYSFGLDKYVSNRPRLNGPSLLKQRTIVQGGVPLINLPYFEWWGADSPDDYLRCKIAAATRLPGSRPLP